MSPTSLSGPFSECTLGLVTVIGDHVVRSYGELSFKLSTEKRFPPTADSFDNNRPSVQQG